MGLVILAIVSSSCAAVWWYVAPRISKSVSLPFIFRSVSLSMWVSWMVTISVLFARRGLGDPLRKDRVAANYHSSLFISRKRHYIGALREGAATTYWLGTRSRINQRCCRISRFTSKIKQFIRCWCDILLISKKTITIFTLFHKENSVGCRILKWYWWNQLNMVGVTFTI